MRAPAPAAGFVFIIVSVGLVALAGTAGLLSIVINSAENQHTARALTDPDPASSAHTTVTDQQIQNMRNDLPTNLSLGSNFGQLATPTLPNGESTALLALGAIEEQLRGTVTPEVVNYMSDPGSTWNRNGGADRPGDGTTPTGGLAPEDIPGGTGDVRLTLIWSAPVDLDLHVIDPCDGKINYQTDFTKCEGRQGRLDVDDTDGGTGSVENIYWPEGGTPEGEYQFWVVCFRGCDERSAAYTLTRTVDGDRRSTTGTLSVTGQASSPQTFTR